MVHTLLFIASFFALHISIGLSDVIPSEEKPGKILLGIICDEMFLMRCDVMRCVVFRMLCDVMRFGENVFQCDVM